MLLFPHVVFGVALRLEQLRAKDQVQKPRALRRTRAGGFSSPFLLFEGAGGACATSSFLMFLLFSLRQHRFSFAAWQNNSKETKHSIFLSAAELLHQLLEFNVGHSTNGFVSSSLDGLRINI